MTASPQVVGIAGPSCAGKTWLARRLVEALGRERTAYLSLDSYYCDLSHLTPSERCRCNFDEPGALDWALLREQVRTLAEGQSVNAPCYAFDTHTRTKETELVSPAPYVIVEGLFALHDAAVRDLFQIRVFVDASNDCCLSRRLERDVRERGRTEESVRAQFAATVRPMADRYVYPTRRWADIVVEGEKTIEPAVALLVERLTGSVGLPRKGVL